MPLVIPVMSSILTTNLLATALIGVNTPKLASGVANGLVSWVPQITVSTNDVGSTGVGISIPLPWFIPQPLILAHLSANIPSAGFKGISTPSLILGLANGLSTVFLQMLILTKHFTVGSGTGIAKFSGPSAVTAMISGFSSAGLIGESSSKLAAAIGVSLDATIASLVIPIVITGSGSPLATVGVGSGKIV